MDEGSPWSRLGMSGTQKEVTEAESVDSVSEIVALKDQVFELNKLVMLLQSRIHRLEVTSEEVVENVFSLVSKEELGIVEPEITPEDVAAAMEENEVVVIKSGFTAPEPTELDEIRAEAKKEIEPVGSPPDESAEEILEEKEFGERYTTALRMAELIAEHIELNGAVLNNQVKKRVYTPNDLDVSATDKKLLKELIEEGHTNFQATKLDSFRTLYFIGEDAGVEYEKSYGTKGD